MIYYQHQHFRASLRCPKLYPQIHSATLTWKEFRILWGWNSSVNLWEHFRADWLKKRTSELTRDEETSKIWIILQAGSQVITEEYIRFCIPWLQNQTALQHEVSFTWNVTYKLKFADKLGLNFKLLPSLSTAICSSSWQGKREIHTNVEISKAIWKNQRASAAGRHMTGHLMPSAEGPALWAWQRVFISKPRLLLLLKQTKTSKHVSLKS